MGCGSSTNKTSPVAEDQQLLSQKHNQTSTVTNKELHTLETTKQQKTEENAQTISNKQKQIIYQTNGKEIENMQQKYNDFFDRQKKFENELLQEYKQSEADFTLNFETSHLISNHTQTIKPFLSSTFRDFFEERESLTKRCFPYLENVFCWFFFLKLHFIN